MSERPAYRITFARSARRELESLDPPVGRRVLARIISLANDPRPLGCLKLTGSGSFWRVRAGDWRVNYEIDDRTHIVDIAAVRHRSDAYR